MAMFGWKLGQPHGDVLGCLKEDACMTCLAMAYELMYILRLKSDGSSRIIRDLLTPASDRPATFSLCDMEK